MKKENRYIIAGAVVLTALSAGTALVGYSKNYKQAEKNLNNAGLQALNSSEVVKAQTSDKITNFVFSGADFVLSGGNYIVDISGFTTNEKNVRAYANMEYEVYPIEFKDINEKDSIDVYNALTKVISEYEMKSFDYAPVSDLNKFNDALNQNFQQEIKNYDFSSGLTYAIDDIAFNEQEGYVSFITRSNVRYENINTTVNMMPTPNGMYPMTRVNHDYDYYYQTHEIFIKASPEEIQAMKNDKKLIFDKFVNVVSKNQTSEYRVKQVSNITEKEFNYNCGYSME